MPGAPSRRLFRDRADAGRRLADRLRSIALDAPVVLGLPRGGVVVAAEVARALDAPLDVLVVRKLGAPGHPELGIGAVADGDPPLVLVNDDVIRGLRVRDAYLARETAAQLDEVRRRETHLRAGRPAPALRDRGVIVVDDGIATGGTVRVALRAVRRTEAARVVLAVPVAPPEVVAALAAEADLVVCLEAPDGFTAVGQFYDDFRQTTDDEVTALLAAARRNRGVT
jgi:putative phosphoribosyl transferase